MSHALGVLAVLYLAASAAGAYARGRVFSGVTEEEAAIDATELPPPRRPASSRPASIGIHDAQRSKRLLDEITTRSPFCPACRPETEDGAEGEGADVTWKDGTSLGPLLAQGEPETDLPLQLVATMQAVPPQRSMATIARTEEGGGGAGVFLTGEEVLDGVQLHTIGSGIVHLVGPRIARVPAAARSADRKRPARPTRKKKPPRKGKHEIDGARQAVECDSDTSCTIDRAFVERLMAKPALLARQARIRPYRKDGETLGFKILRGPPGEPAEAVEDAQRRPHHRD